MVEKPSVYHRRAARAFGLLSAWALAGCLAPEPSSSSSTGPNDSGSTGSDATNEVRSDDSGSAPATGDSGGPSDAVGDAGASADASPGSNATTSPAAGPTPNDGGTDGEAGVRDIGSCCSAQTTPGCGDPNLELCVCAKDSTCCTSAWTLGCALIVQQKYCQPNVRGCVCGTDAGQWGQTQCCDTDWNSTCDSVATLKCSAAQGCF